MKKNDLLLKDFDSLEIKSLTQIKGGEDDTNNACTSGDTGCCDTDDSACDWPENPQDCY